jgi:hypothetical protein
MRIRLILSLLVLGSTGCGSCVKDDPVPVSTLPDPQNDPKFDAAVKITKPPIHFGNFKADDAGGSPGPR